MILGSDIICKYFSGIKDSRYGDLQSVRPEGVPCSIPGKFSSFACNGFVNIVLDDIFLYDSIFSFVSEISPERYFVAEPDVIGTNYRRYVFSLYIKDIWNFNLKSSDREKNSFKEYRRLAVMAFYLIKLSETAAAENGPLHSEPLEKLYNIFSNELYCIMTSCVISEANVMLRMLCACACGICPVKA